VPAHDISPAVEDQLVLELESWEASAEVVEVLPTGRGGRLALPLDQHLAHTARHPGSGDLVRRRHHCAMMNWWQRWGRGWRRAYELLEDVDVENIMEAGTDRELQPNSNVVDDLLDAVRTNEARLKLAGRGTGQGRHCSLHEAEECPIADLVVHQPMVLVVHTLLDRLHLFEVIANIIEECSAFLHPLSKNSHARLAGLIRADGRRVAAIDHEQRVSWSDD
jgi:hypothetical protein